MSFISDPVNFIVQWLQNLLLGWGLSASLTQVILFVIGAFILGAGTLFFAIPLIWLERKVGGRIQDRVGPNRLGPWGIFQPFADMFKIFTKEFVTPRGVDWLPYNLAPILAVASVLLIWGVLPFTMTVYGSNLDMGLLYIVAVGGLGELGIIMAGWSSNNKYALLGGFRAVALLVSYEVPLVVTLLVPVMLSGSLRLNEIVQAQDIWFVVLAPAAALLYFIASIAENGRAPFDLVEADSELVAGFNIEYSGLKFGFYFVADFLHAYTVALLFTTIFLGGWRGPWAEQYPILGFFYLFAKSTVVYLFGLLVRFSLPRFRIDQMLNVNWKLLTPLSLAVVIVTALVDKVVGGSAAWLRAVVLIAANLIVLAAGGQVLKAVTSRRTRPLVVDKPRPLARPDTIPGQPESGG